MKIRMFLASAAITALVSPCALLAQGSQSGNTGMAPATPHADAGGMQAGGAMQGDDSMKAMMEAGSKAARPGEQHKHLAMMAGKWSVTGKAWMGPGAPMEVHSTSEATMIMGGRYLQQVHKGSFMGQPFEGRSIDGYDNTTHEYFSTWIDNMGTGVEIFRGSCDEPCKTLTETAEMIDPATGKKGTSKEVITILDKDNYRTEMYMVGGGPGGQDLKVMELNSKRVK